MHRHTPDSRRAKTGRQDSLAAHRRTHSCPDLADRLAPLLQRIGEYDVLRLKLQSRGGNLPDLDRITQLLNTKVTLPSSWRDIDVTLTDPAALRSALHRVDPDLELDVRRLGNALPVYYVCRTRPDYWREYNLVVEDYYRSPGYTLLDERFVRLMDGGHESYFLRLSPFRQKCSALPARDRAESPEDIDDLLHDLGRFVFQAAWHDDQRVGVLVAEHFALPYFKNCIELLYLNLSGELCSLRNVVDGRMLRFFSLVYPQPAIRAFLRGVAALDGISLSELPQKALPLYSRLSKAFGRFITVEVPWGARQTALPLYKLIFANLYRLDLVAGPLRKNEPVAQAATRLEKEAHEIIDQIAAA